MLYTIVKNVTKKQFFGIYNYIHVTTDATVTPSYQSTKTSELAYAVNMGLSPK